ncbi:MAG: proline iminopeptidase [Bacteriovoracaceae bacterium]|jgi:proline iminopeptidase
MPKFTTKLGTTFYIKKGRRTKKYAIISCHGGPGGTHHSTKPILDLSIDRQVVVYDQIGSGLSSDIPKSQWTIDIFCKNLDELINHLGYDKVILHGSSWGGTLILEYFKKHPKKVAGLIFHSSLISEAIWRKDAQELISKLPKKTREIIQACEKVGATDSKVYKIAMTEYYQKHVCRDKSTYIETKTQKRPNEKMYNYMWGPSEFCATGTLKKYNGINILKTINIPTLFISGQYDEATPKSAQYFSKKVKGGKFIEIKGASHSSLRELPKKTLKHFTDFLNTSYL